MCNKLPVTGFIPQNLIGNRFGQGRTDPQGESESHQILEPFMREAGVPPVEVERSMKLNMSRDFAKSARPLSVPPVRSEVVDHEEILVEEGFRDQECEVPAKKRKEHLHSLYSASRSETPGRHPKAVRTEISLASTCQKRPERVRACFAIPRLDYLKFRYVVPAVPPRSQYHQVCKLCTVHGNRTRLQ